MDDAENDRRAWARETLARLDVLPHEQVQALRLVYRDGLLQYQAAARLDISLIEFARRVSTGLQSLGESPVPTIG